MEQIDYDKKTRYSVKHMEKIIQIGFIIIAAASVAAADILIKKSAFQTQSLSTALKNPLMIIAATLYLLQIVLMSYIFVKKWDLGIVGIMQMAVFGTIIIIFGIAFFQEKITLLHGIGMALALIGAIFMNL